MSISLLIDAISKLSEGEVAVLREALATIRQDVANANNSAMTAVLWSQFTLKSQRNANANFKDPITGLPITEPDFQTVDGYPIIFGNANSPGTPARSTTFAFGSKAFLGYENDAQGTPYIDLNYVGNTAHDLSEIEVVNYRTLMSAISEHGGNLNQTYIIKQGDSVPIGAVHTFGKVFFRGGEERVYYGTDEAVPGKEITVKDDLIALHNTINNETTTSLNTLHNTITEEVNDSKVNKSGDVITGFLDVNERSPNDNGVVRNIDLEDLANVYINKSSDATPAGSHHEFGAVQFRGGSEKVYYADSEIASQYYANSIVQETIQGLTQRLEFTPGTYIWNSGSSTIIELFQVGSGSGTGTLTSGGGGGGLKTKLSILPNTDYTIIVGAGGMPDNDGEDTSFSGEIGSLSNHYTKTLITAGGKKIGTGGNVIGLKTISGAALNSSSDFSIEFGLPYGILDVMYAPGAGGADTIGMAGSIGMYSGGANIGGGASAFGNGSIEGCTISSPDSDQAGIGGGAGLGATTSGGDGILIINTFI